MNTIANVNKYGRNIWLVIAVMSIVIILISIFFMSIPEISFDISMDYPGSSLVWKSLDQETRVGMRFLIIRPFMDEILFGVLGLYCAWALKKRAGFAWNLSLIWGVLMLSTSILIGLSEIIIGKWTSVCLVTIVYSIIGATTIGSLLFAKKEFV